MTSPGMKSNDSNGPPGGTAQTKKKKQVETPAFGTKDKGFFRENQRGTSPIKEVRDFLLTVPIKEIPNSNKSSQKKISTRAAVSGIDSANSGSKQSLYINSATSSR